VSRWCRRPARGRARAYARITSRARWPYAGSGVAGGATPSDAVWPSRLADPGRRLLAPSKSSRACANPRCALRIRHSTLILVPRLPQGPLCACVMLAVPEPADLSHYRGDQHRAHVRWSAVAVARGAVARWRGAGVRGASACQLPQNAAHVAAPERRDVRRVATRQNLGQGQ
jgi:hypothetical protein